MTAAPPGHDDFVRAMLAYLGAHAGEHRRAHYHADVERGSGTRRARAFRAHLLGADDIVIVPDGALDGALDRLLDATEGDAPITTVDFALQKTGDAWTHRGFIHTAADRRSLDDDRAALDERLRTALTRVPGPWGRLMLHRGWGNPVDLSCLYGLYDPEKLAPTSELLALLDEYDTFFGARSLALKEIDVTLRSETPDEFHLDLHYGVPEDA